MRILLLDNSPIWLNGLAYGLRDAGHEVMASGPLTKVKIPRLIRKFRPHWVLVTGWGSEQTVQKQEWIREGVRATGVPLIYWATEDPHFAQVFTLPLLMRMRPDFVFTISARMVGFYQRLGFRSAWLDFGWHPAIHRRFAPQDAYKCEIAVVAGAYPQVLTHWPEHYRRHSLQTLIQPLIEQQIRIDFWGKHWEQMEPFLGRNIPSDWLHGHLTYPEAAKVYSSARIVIGLQNYPEQVTQRTYEILGSGGLLLTSDTPGVRQWFQPGMDLAVSGSPGETLAMVEYFLNHPVEREEIRARGNAAAAVHSYTRRAAYLLEVLRNAGIISKK